jgi:hypothetical protein
MNDKKRPVTGQLKWKVEEVGDLLSSNYGMERMLDGGGGGRIRKRRWRSNYITDQFLKGVSSLKTW